MSIKGDIIGKDMKKLSDIVSLAGKIARERRVSYPIAVRTALEQSGFPNPTNSVGISRIVNDIGVPNHLPLRSAVLSVLGKKGAETRMVRVEQGRQMDLVLA